MPISLERYFYKEDLSDHDSFRLREKIKRAILVDDVQISVQTELCFYVELSQEKHLKVEKQRALDWILSESFKGENLRMKETWLTKESDLVVEIGPRLNFTTPWSANAVSIFRSVQLDSIQRIEKSRRYAISFAGYKDLLIKDTLLKQRIADVLHDKMTEQVYDIPLESFAVSRKAAPVHEVDVLEKGSKALHEVNKELGLSFDDWDIEFYTNLFKEKLKRNPTTVECFDLAQSNSEHSRHWFFKGNMIIGGNKMPNSLMELVMSTQESSSDNNVIKFCDNSSAIKGYDVSILKPRDPTVASAMEICGKRKRHITFTAETHNFPTGVAPFPGATTGTGGRIRDNHAAGRGAHVIAATVGYCFGNLHIPGYPLPWEEEMTYPSNFASPLQITIEASNGASDYGNKFGEPVIAGFVRSFGMKDSDGTRKEWIKPIMFSGGLGAIEDSHLEKFPPAKGMKVVKVGGPVYRIGVGGGAASSVQVQGDNAEALDFGAVQRGDAEMEQKLNRLIRACIELDERNPICSIHDQGAGGNGNVLKEIVDPAGAVIYGKAFEKGDPTISTLELWGAEYQESDALLVKEEDCPVLEKIGRREKVPVCFVGDITGDGRIVLDEGMPSQYGDSPQGKKSKLAHPVDLPLDVVLGKMPRKTFQLESSKESRPAFEVPADLELRDALLKVMKLPSVGSKRFLTNKVDRCVTGLVAQQQCVGPLHTPLADVAVVALSHFDTVGAATAIGEQPIKGLVNSACGAEMSLGEALTNLVFANITCLEDVKCSVNWMWPAKLPGEGAKLYEACQALVETMKELGVAIDGGKDSLSMAARVGGEVVKAPGAVVVSAYAPCPDITKTVTPDLKCYGFGVLLWVDLSWGHTRLGGSALAQVFNQIGDCAPTFACPRLFAKAFRVTQDLLADSLLKSGHDVSDGGVLVAAIEMAIAGNCGLQFHFDQKRNSRGKADHISNGFEELFSEELGLLLEVARDDVDTVIEAYEVVGIPCSKIGRTGKMSATERIHACYNDKVFLDETVSDLRSIWESTSFQLERLQTNPQCATQEEAGLKCRKGPDYRLTFTPMTPVDIKNEAPESCIMDATPRVAVIREEGSNGDREMIASLIMAGFQAWDVTMTDLCSGTLTLDGFHGLVFVGGFSYADVLGSAKGWAAVARFNALAERELERFRRRENTFSLGVCNGCQLMALLGWVGSAKVAAEDRSGKDVSPSEGVCFTHNVSGRFECRFVTVKISKTPAIMFTGMEDSVLGIWAAHGEGRVAFASPELKEKITQQRLIPLQYVDDAGEPTECYPLNPNGSPNGIAGLVSPDGRHLAMMPHPERTTLCWQWPWMPSTWRKSLDASPWLQMFHNAFAWCLEHPLKE